MFEITNIPLPTLINVIHIHSRITVSSCSLRSRTPLASRPHLDLQQTPATPATCNTGDNVRTATPRAISHPGHREFFNVAATELGDEMVDWFAFIIFIVILFVADFLILNACLFLVAHHLLIKRLRI
ncbi:uncharacterized protein LOC111887314 [Lactuca sativa]|uniref:Uncharacterized protein n=1 Tax=Lactuca sativa TaxID=4236 RepID=A0A9R1VEX9_LACSA|nr:uncharacterized protein LOC111887314 [Lactuca sativa]KAJ0204890.1 hypothetical protein LSAT_V11C500291520 [Lactuca sativa]